MVLELGLYSRAVCVWTLHTIIPDPWDEISVVVELAGVAGVPVDEAKLEDGVTCLDCFRLSDETTPRHTPSSIFVETQERLRFSLFPPRRVRVFNLHFNLLTGLGLWMTGVVFALLGKLPIPTGMLPIAFNNINAV